MMGVVIFLSIPEQNQYGGRVCRNQSLTAAELKPQLRNAFEGKELAFIQAAVKYEIDVALLVAIAQHETGYGTSLAVRERNNPGGVMTWDHNGVRSLRRFSSLEEGIDFMAGNLYRLYISQGLTTIPEIGAKYAPLNDSSLNNHWVPTVTAMVEELGGLKGTCMETGGLIDGEVSASGFQMPVKKANIVTQFGITTPIISKGIDFELAEGDHIIAVSTGTVEYVGTGEEDSPFRDCGQCIVINHHNGYWSLYGQIKNSTVKEGDKVQRGQVIGQAGLTDYADKPHLYFELKTSFEAGQIDPLLHLP